MIKRFFCFFLIVFSFIFGSYTLAQNGSGIEVSPHIIDEQVQARDVLKYTVILTNNTDKKVNLYAQVHDVHETEGRIEYVEPAKLDKATSLARWILIKRASIELMPGASTTESLEVKVNLGATPGKRHAVIAFPEGSNLYEAKGALGSKAHPQIMLNFEVIENIIEKAQINTFKPTRNIFTKPPAEFELVIENFGNREITPEGKMYIYNRQGEELADININDVMGAIPAGEIRSVKFNWQPTKAMGKFKARLEIEYGDGRSRDLQDTVYFWVLPLPYLIAFLIGVLVVTFLLVFIIFRKTYRSHHPYPAPMVNKSNGVINLKDEK